MKSPYNIRHGFTMIELVFVIVILGILAAVALPRLVATRDDAKTVTLARMIKDGSFEIATYAVAHGETNESFANMSNNFQALETKGIADLTTDKKAVIRYGDVSDCVTVEVNTSDTNETLVLTPKANGGNDPLCSSLHRLIHPEIYPMQLRGQLVER